MVGCRRIIRLALAGGVALTLWMPGFGPATAAAQVYQYVDSEGTIHFSNVPTDPRYRPRGSSSSRVRRSARAATTLPTAAVKETIRSVSSKYDMDPALIDAVIRAESSYDSSAISDKGAMGLMQLMPLTAALMDVDDPFDPKDNIEGGVRYLRYLLNQFDGDLKLAVAAYHAGETRVQRYNGVPPIDSTRVYVRKVLGLYGGKKVKAAARPLYRVVIGDQIIYTNNPESYPGTHPALIGYNR